MHEDQLRKTAQYYDNTDTSDHIPDATWEDPGPPSEPMVTYALRLPHPVLDQLRDAAGVHGIKVSALMREWLEERLVLEGTHGSDATIPVSALLALVAERSTGGFSASGTAPPRLALREVAELLAICARTPLPPGFITLLVAANL